MKIEEVSFLTKTPESFACVEDRKVMYIHSFVGSSFWGGYLMHHSSFVILFFFSYFFPLLYREIIMYAFHQPLPLSVK